MKNLSLKDFLKTYTAISNKFIDEYYYFYELCENNNYGINTDLVIKYLGYKNTKKFYERLRKNYVLNIDFIIKRKINPGSKTAKRIDYYLSLECFEKICMESRTPKGEAVRDYFIVLRKFINYYKIHFANTINKLAQTKKYVYIILVDKNKNIQKFGRTIDMRKRLYSYATGKASHPDIKFIMIVDEPKRLKIVLKYLLTNTNLKINKNYIK
jgi:phage anti-repressor protein